MNSQASGRPTATCRIVGWNCNGGLAGRKAERLADLRPDIAVIAECAESAQVPGLVRIAWTGKYPTKGFGVFARPDLGATVDDTFDARYEWFLPVHIDSLDVDILGVWAMNLRGGEGQPQWRTRRAVAHYREFLSRGRSVVIGDFNDNVRWDRPSYPAFSTTLEDLGALGYVSLYHARTGQRHGAETDATLYWRRKRDAPYLIDHAFVPASWLPAVGAFEIGTADDWLDVSDHMPLILDIPVPTPATKALAHVSYDPPTPPRSEWLYSERLLRAMDVAARMHAKQKRKKTEVPYLSHLLGTCAIALEYGASEDEAIAALLHDAIEDVEPVDRSRAAVAAFGPKVLAIVEACSDADAGAKGPWRERKEAYIARIAHEGASVLLVSASDKLHNARAIVADVHSSGADVWNRFNAGRADVIWYYEALVRAFAENPAHSPGLINELGRVVGEMRLLGNDQAA